MSREERRAARQNRTRSTGQPKVPRALAGAAKKQKEKKQKRLERAAAETAAAAAVTEEGKGVARGVARGDASREGDRNQRDTFADAIIPEHSHIDDFHQNLRSSWSKPWEQGQGSRLSTSKQHMAAAVLNDLALSKPSSLGRARSDLVSRKGPEGSDSEVDNEPPSSPSWSGNHYDRSVSLLREQSEPASSLLGVKRKLGSSLSSRMMTPQMAMAHHSGDFPLPNFGRDVTTLRAGSDNPYRHACLHESPRDPHGRGTGCKDSDITRTEASSYSRRGRFSVNDNRARGQIDGVQALAISANTHPNANRDSNRALSPSSSRHGSRWTPIPKLPGFSMNPEGAITAASSYCVQPADPFAHGGAPTDSSTSSHHMEPSADLTMYSSGARSRGHGRERGCMRTPQAAPRPPMSTAAAHGRARLPWNPSPGDKNVGCDTSHLSEVAGTLCGSATLGNCATGYRDTRGSGNTAVSTPPTGVAAPILRRLHGREAVESNAKGTSEFGPVSSSARTTATVNDARRDRNGGMH